MTINVVFKHIRSNSGVDVWVKMLVDSLKKEKGINTQIEYYNWYYVFYPKIIKKIENKNLENLKVMENIIIHSNIDYSYVFKEIADFPLISTAHHIVHREWQYLKYTNQYQKAYYKLLWHYQDRSLKYSDVVTSVSKYTKRKLEDVFGYSDAKVIYNGIDQEVFKPQESFITAEKLKIGNKEIVRNNKVVLLFSGNPSKRKGLDIIVKLLNKFKQERTQDKFIFIFTGLKNTSSFINNFRTLGSIIVTLGRISLNDLVKAYNFSDIFVFPSRLEGFGLSIAEAMACKKPVISTKYSSIPELVIPDKGGILCTDYVNCFYDAILYLSEDENLRKKMGEFNRKRVMKKFTLARMAKEYAKLYKKLGGPV